MAVRVLLQSAVIASALVAPMDVNAADCLISGPRPQLDGQTVAWQMNIRSGQRCLRGLRAGAMLIESVAIGTPPKNGTATIQGYSFAYNAAPSYQGDDTFTVILVGTYRGNPGRSVIDVRVNVR